MLSDAKALFLTYWPIIAWFVLAKALGASDMDAFLLAAVLWLVRHHMALSERIHTLERNAPPPP